MSVSYYIRETRGWGSPDRWTTESEEELQRLVRSKTAYDLNPDRSRARFWNDLWTLGEASTGGSLPIIAYAERPAEMSNLKRNPSMSSRIRQHKSPYFYVRKGSGFVLLDNHEETSTRYKTEAEAKKAVLALNDAWRAKHAPRANPGPMMYSIMRAQEEARKKAKRNPRRSLTTARVGDRKSIRVSKAVSDARIQQAVDAGIISFWASIENAYPTVLNLEPDDDIAERSRAYLLKHVKGWVRKMGYGVGAPPKRRNGKSDRMHRAVEAASIACWAAVERSLPEVYRTMERTPFGYANDVEVDAFNAGMASFVQEWLDTYPGGE